MAPTARNSTGHYILSVMSVIHSRNLLGKILASKDGTAGNPLPISIGLSQVKFAFVASVFFRRIG